MTIPVARPILLGNEWQYVCEALDAYQLSGGPFLVRFEQAFAEWLGVKHAIAVSSGTAALHMALLAVGVRPGDEVIVPDVTFIATANAVAYCNATPALVDIDPDTWTLDVRQVKKAIATRTKAIIAVHLYGVPAALDELRALADEHGLALIEDAAEALGSRYRGRLVGSLGDVGCFSFYGNKTITTGEGGMVTTGDDFIADRLRLLRGQGQEVGNPYWHVMLGYNYRLSELQAAVGLAQLEKVETHLAARRRVRDWYERYLTDERWQLQTAPAHADPVFWMNVARYSRPGLLNQVVNRLSGLDIETRPVFAPMHWQPMYGQPGQRYLASEALWRSGLVLPTYAGLTEEQVQTICEAVQS